MEKIPGQTLRGYQLRELIGSGGFGEVYRAYQPAVDRQVALKVILPQFAEHPDFVARFEAEARTVAKLEHPHIVPLYDFWHDEHGAVLVMRYLKGGSLRDRLEAEGALDPVLTGRLLQQVCAALEAAHQAGIVHRDLKPENILLDKRGEAYLSDFGIAKDLSAQALTETGKLTGSVLYLAPEQAQANPVTAATDIYALGVLLYELLSGEHPFPDLTPIQVIQRHLNEPLPPLSERRDDLPEAIDLLIQQATAKDASSRHSDALQLAIGFQAALAAEPARPQLPEYLRSDELPAEATPETFVGRQAELGQLGQLLEQAMQGRSQIGFVTGGPGRGKTTLTQRFAAQARRDHPELVVAVGSANAFSGVGDPYLPFRDILSTLTGDVEARWSGGQLSTAQARDLWELIPHSLESLLEHGADLIDVFVEARTLERHAAAAGVPAAQLTALRAGARRNQSEVRNIQQAQLFEQYTTVLRQIAAARPLLLVLDDLQWADGASISLLFHLARRLESARILLLGTYREEELALGRDGDRHPLDKVITELRQARGEIRIELDREQELEGREFLDALLDSEPNQLGPQFREQLFQRTGGHPLFTVELLRAMQERGDLVQDQQGRWSAGDTLAWDQLPEKVEAVIEERIQRLEDELRELLSVASVEGEQFTAQVVAGVQEAPERDVLRRLSRQLEKRHRLVREQGETRAATGILSQYRFGHQLFQSYLYQQLGAGERRLLHQEVAQALERLYGDQAIEISVQLARHYQEAGDSPRAIAQLLQAGKRARRLFANLEALAHFNRALELAGEDRHQILVERAAVLVDLYRGEQAVLDYQELLDRARQLHDREAEVAALLGLGRAHYIVSLDHPEAGAASDSQSYYEQAYALAEQLDDKPSMIRALVPTTWFVDFWPEYAEQARANAEQALELSAQVQDELLAIEAELAMFYTDPLPDRPERGERILQRLEARGDLARQNYLLFGLMFSSRLIGEYEKTLEYCDRGIALAERIGVPPVQYPTSKGLALVNLGRFDQAWAAFEQEVADEAHRLGRGFRQLGMAFLFYELQAFQRCLDTLHDLLPAAEQLARAWMIDSLHYLMVRAALRGELEVPQRSLEYLDRSDTNYLALAPAEYALQAGDDERARRKIHQAQQIFLSTGRQPMLADSMELLARLELQAGDPEAALAAAERGVELAAALKFRALLWRLHARRAEALQALGRAAEAQAERSAGAAVLEQLAENVSDPELRAALLESPEARRVRQHGG